MKRIILLAATTLSCWTMWGAPAHAAATCDTINAGEPALTVGSSGHYFFTSPMHVANCSAKTYIVTTLLVEHNGAFTEAGCDGQAPPSCAVIYPTTGGGCDNGLHFCAYSNIWRYPETNPNGGECGLNYRSRLQVYGATGTFLGQATSTTARC